MNKVSLSEPNFFNVRLLNSLIFFILFATKVFSQAAHWEWGRGATSISTIAWSEGWCVATDKFENVYIAGSYKDTVTFGPFTFITPSLNIYLVKYDSSGNILWAKSATGQGNGWAQSIATDNFGNVFLTGKSHVYPIIFDSDTLINSGSNDIFIVKFDSSGTELWGWSIGGSSDDAPNSIATDSLGNAFITGYYQSDSLTFGTHTINNLGNGNIFLAKYDSAGNAIWARNAGGTLFDIGYGVSTDMEGDIYVTGGIESSIAYFGGVGVINSTGNTCFLAMYDSGGNVVFVKTGIGGGEGLCLATDPFKNIYVAGIFGSNITFDSFNLTGTTANNVFIVKYDAQGNVLFAKNDVGYSSVYSIATDTCGNAYISGTFLYNTTPISFDTIVLQPPLTSPDAMFLVKYNGSGDAESGFVLPSGGDDNNGIAAGRSGCIYLTGDLDMYPFIIGPDTLNYPGTEIAFVAKLKNSVECPNILVNEINNSAHFSLFPNPFTSNLTLNFSTSLNSNADLRIFNSIGEMIREKEIMLEDQTLNLSTLPQGIYLVSVSTEKEIWTEKILKENVE